MTLYREAVVYESHMPGKFPFILPFEIEILILVLNYESIYSF